MDSNVIANISGGLWGTQLKKLNANYNAALILPITQSEMPPEQRYNKLKQESKKFKNAIIMLSYRAETALYNILKNFSKEQKTMGECYSKKYFQAMQI